MLRSSVRLSVLALIVAVLGVAPALAETPQPEAQEVTLEQMLAVPGSSCDDQTPAEVEIEGLTPEWDAQSCCKDQCFRDRDCDRICGAKGAGDCIQLNSCCKECTCLF